MDNHLYSDGAPLAQAQPNGFISVEEPVPDLIGDRLPGNLIDVDEFARSQRGDSHVIAAAVTIEREKAGVSPPEPQITPYSDDGGWSEASPSTQTPPEHALAAQRKGKRLIRLLRQGKATNLAAKRVRLRKPRSVKQAARARAVHSHSSHGGSRKAGDDGDGDGEGPPRIYRQSVEVEPWGVRVLEDGVVLAEFDSIAEAVRFFLAFEQWARAQGAWSGPSYQDETHPLSSLIREGLS